MFTSLPQTRVGGFEITPLYHLNL